MSDLCFINGNVVTSWGVSRGARISMGGECIAMIDAADSGPTPIDLEGGWLLPGFIDTQVCAPEDIKALASAGVRVSAGHTDATYDQMMAAVHAGLNSVTHLFNAMSPLHHRELGVVGAALDAGLWCGLIADGAHVHPAALRIAVRALAADRLMLVTDAMPSVGATSKDFVLQGKQVTVSNGVCRGPDGQLAGSDLDMAQAVRNMVAMTSVSVEAASAMASRNPASYLGLSHERGALAPGLRADLVWLDRYLAPVATWIGGQRVSSR